MGPRRSIVVPAAIAPLPTLIPPPPPSPLIQRLRKDWRWAGISQFIWTFSDAFGLLDWDIETLETDLDQDEMAMTPDLIAKMLYALTYNRQINRDNAFDHLRKQYAKRDPDHLLLGTEEEPRQWAALELDEKVQALWDLCEWQMADPARFRALLKGEEEAASWRIEPVGWDKEGNTYFLFDDNRLWIKRARPAPPRPARQAPQKAKKSHKKRIQAADPGPSSPAKSTPRPKAKVSHKKKVVSPDLTPPPPSPPAEDTPITGRRQRAQVAFYGNPVSTVAALKRGGLNTATPTSSNSKITRSSSRGGLTVPEVVVPLETPSRGSGKAAPASGSISRGSRSTRRTRDTGDEWQAIPAEWMEPEGEVEAAKEEKKANGTKKAPEEESELSSLTDEVEEAQEDSEETRRGDEEDKAEENAEEEAEVQVDEVEEAKHEDDEDYVPGPEEGEEDVEMKDEAAEEKPAAEVKAEGEEEDEVKIAAKEAAIVPPGLVEWEAVCVTLYDWRTFPEQFAKSRHPDEKNLYTLLVDAVGPTVIQALVAKEQERLRQEAINNRKRSSRIATKELAKEEIARREKAQREMEERMEKSRREETYKMRSEATVVSQEKAREDRIKEREDRIAAREIAAAQKAEEEQKGKDKADRARIRRQRRREGEVVDTSEESEGEGSTRPSNKRSRVSTPSVPQKKGKRGADEGWELNCEICRKSGWNLDDDAAVVSCDDCGRWQHTDCHNKQDLAEGRPIRNWEKVDFKCKECRRKTARKRQRLSNEPRNSPLASTPLYANGSTNGHANGIHPAVNFGPTGGPPPANPNGTQYAPMPGQGGPRASPSVPQAPVQGQQQMQSQRPPAGYPYAPQGMQQYPPGYPQGYRPQPMAPGQYPPGYRPHPQSQSLPHYPQQTPQPQYAQPPRYPPSSAQQNSQYLQQAQHQYAHYAQSSIDRPHSGSPMAVQQLLHPSLQNGASPIPRPGSASGPSRPNGPAPGPAYGYPPQPAGPPQGGPRPQHAPQYAPAPQQMYQHRPMAQQYPPQAGQYASPQPQQPSPVPQLASSAPSQGPPKSAQQPGSVGSLLNAPNGQAQLQAQGPPSEPVASGTGGNVQPAVPNPS